MFVGIDIAARSKWLRNADLSEPRIRVTTPCTFSASACALRQTLRVLKSLTPNEVQCVTMSDTSFARETNQFPRQKVPFYPDYWQLPYCQLGTRSVRQLPARSPSRPAFVL